MGISSHEMSRHIFYENKKKKKKKIECRLLQGFLELKGNGYTFRGGKSVELVLSSSEKGSTLKGKNSFLLESRPFSERA